MSQERPHYGAMTEERANDILGFAVGSDASLAENRRIRVAWRPGDRLVHLEGDFSLEYLDALAWWLRNKSS
jgi:hypothetical protein